MLWSVVTVISILAVSLMAQSQPFTDQQIEEMRSYFEANIGLSNCATGFVVASPSGGPNHNSGDPDYYYHWQRDAAVSMHTLQYTANNTADFDQRFRNYVTWIKSVQIESDPNGINVLGEPKFYCNGSVFSGGWCRPQNDGPASRAIAQITYAFYLLNNSQSSYVTSNLYIPGSGNSTKTCTVQNQNKVDCGYVGINETQCEDKGCCWYEIDNNPNNYPWCYYQEANGGPSGTIPTDLNYVSTVWNNGQSCDLWEEVRGTFFYTTMVQRYALYYGAALARALNDNSTATTWETTAASIDSTIKGFDNNGVIQDSQRTWDCSIIVGTLYGGTPDIFQPTVAAMYPPSNADILNTISQIVSYWASDYTINQQDDSANIPGTLIGRYENDHYSGCNNGGGSAGHAWVLCSNALADVYYRNALYLHENREKAKELLTPRHIEIYSDLFEKDQPTASKLLREYAIQWKDSIDGEYEIDYTNIMEQISQMAATQGDNQLTRVAYHVDGDCTDGPHLSEQICEASTTNGGGQEVGAHDLTWSYGTVLSAWYYRGLALENGVTFYPNEKSVDEMVWTVARHHLGAASQTCGGELCNSQCSD